MQESEIITADGFKIGKQWLKYIQFIQSTCPNGDVEVRFADGNPTRLLKAKPDVRFDKGEIPTQLVQF